MRCGVSVLAMNDQDVERCAAGDWSRPPVVPDHEVWDKTLALGDLIEPLGFDSIWTVEHFATPYCMVPSALQHLAYWAGRTERVDMGTVVVVAPWHHPVQLAHEIAMLDILLRGRNYTIGLGRGLSPREYAPLGVPQETSRQRFDETIQILQLAFSKERFSFDGEIFQIPETSIRPQPRHRKMMDNAIAAFMTPASLEVVARAGLGQAVVSLSSYEQVGRDNVAFNQIRSDAGFEPDSQPTIYMIGVYCAETEDKAREGFQYLARLGQVSSYHYGMAGNETFDYGKIPGYEAYAKGMPSSGGAPQSVEEAQKNTMVGTPQQLVERMRWVQEVTNCREIVVAFDVVGSQPKEDVERSMRLFAKEVLPAVGEISTEFRLPQVQPV